MYPGQNGPVADHPPEEHSRRAGRLRVPVDVETRPRCGEIGTKDLSRIGGTERLRLCGIPETVVKSLTEFTEDGSAILAVRREIAGLIEQAQ